MLFTSWPLKNSFFDELLQKKGRWLEGATTEPLSKNLEGLQKCPAQLFTPDIGHLPQPAILLSLVRYYFFTEVT